MVDQPLSQQLSMAMDNIKRAQKHMRKVFNTDDKPLFLLMHFDEVAQGGSIKISALKEALGVTAAAATQFVKRLEHFGYVERKLDHSDRRIINVYLNPKGIETVNQTKACFGLALNGLVEDLGQEDTKTLIRLLNKTSIYLEKEFLK